MNKHPDSSCPNCHARPCAEFQLKGESPQWKCNDCGASGWLIPFKKPPAPPRVHRNPGKL